MSKPEHEARFQTFESWYYRFFTFLAGDAEQPKIRFAAARTIVILVLGFLCAAGFYLAVNVLILGASLGSAGFSMKMDKELANLNKELSLINPLVGSNAVAGQSAATNRWPTIEFKEAQPARLSYAIQAVVTSGTNSRLFTVFGFRRSVLRWLTFDAVSEVSSESLGHIISLGVLKEGESLSDVDENTRLYVQSSRDVILKFSPLWHRTALRKLNGAIQFCTFWVFFALIIQVIAREFVFVRTDRLIMTIKRVTYPENFRNELKVYKQDISPWAAVTLPFKDTVQKGANAEVHDGRELSDMFSECIQKLKKYSSAFGHQIISPFLELNRVAFLASQIDLSTVPDFVNNRADSLLDRIYTSASMIRFCIWAIPTIGFIGTVVGIGDSLMQSGSLQSIDPITRVVGKSIITTSIGVAFDTTLVGLLLSLLGMFAYHRMQEAEEAQIQFHKDRAVRALVATENLAKSPVTHGDVYHHVYNVAPSEEKGSSGRIWIILLILLALVTFLLLRFGFFAGLSLEPLRQIFQR